MRILLVQPPVKSIYGAFSGIAPCYPPMSLAYICSVLEKDGHGVEILDMDVDCPSKDDFAGRIRRFKPGLIGFTSTTPTYPGAIELAREAKKLSDAPVIFGGCHVSARPFECLGEEKAVDYVVVGEGEYTMREVAGRVERDASVAKVRGIAYRTSGKRFKLSKPRPLVENLDELPFPAWHKFDFSRYSYGDAYRGPIAPILTSRGCPGRCVYCSKAVFGKTFRMRSCRNVIDELELLTSKFGIKEVHILDENFALSKAHAEGICEEIARRRMDLTVNCMDGIRVNNADRRLLEKMKRAGFYSLAFGIESGDQKVLNRIKKDITLRQARRAVRLAKEVGLDVWGFFMIGLPGDTKTSVMKTIDFACELQPTVAKFHITKPLPGSEMFDDWVGKRVMDVSNWADFGLHTKPVHALPDLSSEEMLELQKLAYRKFYLNPAYILNAMRSIKSWRQVKFYIRALKAILS